MRVRLLAPLTLALLVSACGGDGTQDSPDASVPDADPPDAQVDVIAAETDCANLVDDDGDGDTDCADADCAADPECVLEVDCSDGVDNEGDGEADCLDADCDGVDGCEHGAEVSCADGFDNDGDGNTDCEDANCDGLSGCRFAGELTCDDGFDNDGDGSTDCVDADCNGVAGCELGAELTCNDGFDNDGDGSTDCVDADCDGVSGCELGAELTCNDGFDNDADGSVDCADADCDGVSGCELGTELTCYDGLDNDGDGGADCADPDCDPWCWAGCAPGQTLITVSATDLPQAFGGAPTQVASSIVVSPTGVVTGAAVAIDVTHPYVADVDVRLISTTGTTIDLSTGNGGSGDDYSGTVFSDGAATPITAGVAPFIGAFAPEAPLSTLDGERTDGTWQLQATDTFPGVDDGALAGFTLHLCLCSGLPGCELGDACADGISNDDDTLVDCADGDCDGTGFCEFGVELSCSDGNDNDADGDTDCDDVDCSGVPVCSLETPCNDGIDNDGDGFTDCLDPACDGLDGCEFGVELSCDDGIDNDGDGFTDCPDADCAPTAICSIPLVCPAGARKYGVTAVDTPVAISDGVTSTSNVGITAAGVVIDAAVRVNITHTWVSDLDISLIPPAPGPSRDLSSDNGGSGDNYTDTVFTDAATTSITTGVAPFTGSFRPEQPMSGLVGSPLGGTWTLSVFDDAGGDTGSLTEFSLVVCGCDPAGTNCEFGPLCADGINNDGDAFTDCADSNCAGDPRCLPEPICNDGVDNDFDGNVDCADTDCNGVAGCEFGAEVTCNDMFDNDADGQADCSDADCAASPACAVPEADCANGIDDDFDTLTDCNDPDCGGISNCEDEATNNSAVDSLTSPQGVVTASGTVRRGSINTIGDRDYFAITLTAATDLRLDAFAAGVSCPSGFDPDLRLFAVDGTTQLAYDDLDAWSGGGSGFCPHIGQLIDTGARRLAPGTYYVSVEEFGNNGLLANYELFISFEAVCGDGRLEGSETCDDGNTTAGDGCDASCLDEVAGAVCPNGIIETGEECDGGAACDVTCVRIPLCGDGFVDGLETCDDGNTAAADGCSASCTAELVINEVDYDQAGTDTASFIEIYNPTLTTVNLANLRVYLVDGGSNRTYHVPFPLSNAAASLLPGQYLVIANSSVVLPLGTPSIVATGDFIQNGAPDSVVLVNHQSRYVIDALSYEGSVTVGRVPTFPRNTNMVEGTPFAGADTNDNLISLARTPNGVDTNNAATNWTLQNTSVGGFITPGAANP